MKKTYLILAALFTAGVSFSACNTDGENVNETVATEVVSETVLTEPAQTEPAQEEKKGMVFESTFHDFGKITQGDKVDQIFTFTNESDEPLIISSHHVQCGCTTPEYSKEPIMPGQSSQVKVGFNSAGKSSTQNKTVTLTTNQGTYKLSFKAFVEVAK